MSARGTLLLLVVVLGLLGLVALGLSWANDLIGGAIVLGSLGAGLIASAGAALVGYVVLGERPRA